MLFIYRFFTTFFFPFILIIIFFRKLLGKEESKRYKEKIFSSHFSSNRNFKKKLIWIHAASIGEITSIIPIIKKLNKENSELNFLLTTVTLSSGNLIKTNFSGNKDIQHRYLPVDCDHLVKNFLNVWQPNLIIFVDSEIWPNFLMEIKKRKIKSLLINGRVTTKTYKRWKIFPETAEKIFNVFNLCLAASEDSLKNLQNLKVKNLKYFGNLKFITEKNSTKLDEYTKSILKKNNVWCAASTHEGEEIFCLKTHIEIKKVYKNIITIIIPRHISRTQQIERLSNNLNLKTQILNSQDTIQENNEIIIVNSFGNLTKYFNCCKSIFMGKSNLKKLQLVGGQNPIEAAIMGCKIYHGPYVYNFQEIYSFLESYNISEVISSKDDLAEKLINDFTAEKIIKDSNIKTINLYGEKILENTLMEINNLIKK